MKKLKIILVLFIVITTGCTQKIDFPLPKEGAQRLVVDGKITNEVKAHQVKLTYTSEFNSTIIPAVLGASVSINDGVSRYNLTEKADGIYETDSDVQGEIGKTYQLQITLKNGDYYEANSKMDPVGTIQNIRFEEFSDEEEEGFDIYIDAQGEANYYLFETEINGKQLSTIKDVSYADSSFLLNNQFIDVVVTYIDKLDLKDGSNTISLRMESIDKDYRDFLEAFGFQLNNGEDFGGLFDGPAANIPSNVSNGAVGMFRASAVATKSIEIIK